ncbi:hypothetical protein MuYL_0399 [Mucilaginibacter xinganensis]|uniref:Uncharacterized protein n=1 Tax=Mucilaginibacter xinganensis TaxID=1234841 RepID=A0A223NQW4_9SPHI|nr:hypothetical protein MuYL_0399 [Mucilaginibacter xinganensis]
MLSLLFNAPSDGCFFPAGTFYTSCYPRLTDKSGKWKQ